MKTAAAAATMRRDAISARDARALTIFYFFSLSLMLFCKGVIEFVSVYFAAGRRVLLARYRV